MRTHVQIVLVALILALSSALPVEASLIDFIAENITWEVPQLGSDPVVLNGHMLWNTETGQRVSPLGSFSVTGTGVWQGSWNPYFPERGDPLILLEGLLVGPPNPGSDHNSSGSSFISLWLPQGMTLDTAQPGTYGVSNDRIDWSSVQLSFPGIAAIGGDLRVVGVPLPLLITPSDAVRGALRRLSPPLQYVTAMGTTAILRAVDVPAALRSGLGAYGEYQAYIDLRSVTIQVTEGCNGLGLILTLGVGALLLAPQMRRGALLLVAVLPLALGANALRVAILSLGVERWGVDFVRGPTLAHELVGWLTWLAALVVLIGLAMRMAQPSGDERGKIASAASLIAPSPAAHS